MADIETDKTAEARDGAINLVSSYLSNSSNRLSPDEVQAFIRDTFATLSSLTVPSSAPLEVEKDLTKTKAEIKKSIGAEDLTSFIDGRPYKSLKRHLTTNGHTPESYRAAFGLPADYPMTHPAYSARRSELAKAIGLGSKGRKAKASVPVAASKPAREPRKPKAAEAVGE